MSVCLSYPMPQPDHNTTDPDPNWQALVDQWANCIRQAHDATKQTLGQAAGISDPRVLRRHWFETLAGNMDDYLRSPPFLRMLKTHVAALVQARQLTGDGKNHGNGPFATAGASELPKQFEDFERLLLSNLGPLQQGLDSGPHANIANRAADAWGQYLRTLRVERSASQESTGSTPHEVVYEQDSFKLRRYQSSQPKYSDPLLICYALVNRPYILDLQDDRSVVRVFLDRGFDVYMIDWGIPTDEDRTLRLQDYVGRFIKDAVDFTCRHHGSSQLNLLGYCMGGTMSTMFTALFPSKVRNLILMATPIDFRGRDGLLNLWANEENFDVDSLIDAFGNCPGEFLKYCFQLMKPVQNFAEKYLSLWERMDDSAFLDNFFAMERWANDSVPVAGETFREYVKLLYQQNQLAQGEMTLSSRPVKLESITCPLLMLVADRDHLVPSDSTLALGQIVRSKEVTALSAETGHIGLAVSSQAHQELWPKAVKWIEDHSTPWIKPAPRSKNTES